MTLRRRKKTADGQTARTDSRSSTRSPFVFETLEPRLLLSAGLTAGYAFNETAGTTAADASGHAIVGTLTNGPTWTTGNYGNAVNLDGNDDYVNLGNPTALQVTGSLTLSGWINASAFPIDDAAVVSKRMSGELGFQLDVTKDMGPRTIGFKLTNSSGGQMFQYGATTLQLNTWYHIAGVYDAATQSLHVYLNGQLDDGVLQGTVTASQQNSTANVTIGRRAGLTGFEFAGLIDDVRIYDRALTQAEIQTDKDTSLGAPDTVAPTVTINQAAGQADPTSASTINFAVLFSESVANFTTGDVTLSGTAGATTATVTGSGPTYNVAVTGMTGSGTVIATLAAGVASDAAGNASLVSTSTDNTVTFNATASPTVLSINRLNTNPTNVASVQWTVTFSQSVTGVDAGDFVLAASGVSGATISTVAGSGTTYTVTASTGTGIGTLGLNLLDNDTIINGVSIPLGGAGTGNGNFTGQVYTIDKTAPTGTIVINGGAAATNSRNVTLALSATDALSGVTQMRFSNTGTSFSAAEAYAPTKAWTLTTGAGTKTVYVQFRDGVGNWSTAAITDTIVLDTTAPTISAVTATNITSSSATITWTTNEVATSQVNYGLTTSYGSTTTLDPTLLLSHSVTLTGLAPNTTYNYRVRSLDAAGNERVSANSTFRTAVGVDTVAPTVQSINRVGTTPTNAGSVSWTVLFSESVTGVDLTDFTLAASGVAGATLSSVTPVNGTTYTVTANTGTGSGALGLNLVDNDSILDLSGNRLGGTGLINGDFTGQSYSIDKTAPTATAAIAAVADNVAPVTGNLTTGGATNDTSLALSGTNTALGVGEVVAVYDGATRLGTATQLTGTTWSFSDSSLVNGDLVSYTVRVEDAAGNQGTASAAFTTTIDTAAPTATAAIAAVADNVGTIQGNLTGGGVTDDTSLALSGTNTALGVGEVVAVYDGATRLGTATQLTGTTWSFSDSSLVNGDLVSYTVRAEDAAGNQGTASAAFTTTIDTAAPTATAAITLVTDNFGLNTGNVPNGGSTDDTSLDLSGTNTALGAGEVVAVYDGATRLGTATQLTGTTWSFTDSTLVNGDAVSYTVRVEDAAGNQGTASAARTATISAPTATAAITAVVDDVVPVTGNLTTGGATNDTSLALSGTITGTLNAGEVVAVYDGATKLGNATLGGGNTTWTFTDSTLANGDAVSYTVRVENSAGDQGTASAAFTTTIDTAAPTATVTQAAGQVDPTNTSPINFTVVFSETVTGFAANDISFAGSTVGGTLVANVTGTGPTYTVAVSGMTGTGTVIATIGAGVATDAAGNLTQAATSTDNTVTFSVSQTPGLTAGYAFNEIAGTTAADASGHGLVGTLTNGPTWTPGRYGNALTLDGVNDYVDLGNPTALQVTGSLTLSGWINASAFPVDDAAVVSKRASGESGFQLDVTVDTGPRTIGFKLTNSAGANMFRYGATTLQANTWYHIAGVYDAATQSLHVYLNGQLDDGVLQGTVTATQQNSTANVTIGRRAGVTGFEFAGRIDDVRIYGRALTAAEIQTDLATPLGQPSSTDLIPPQVLINSPLANAQVSNIVTVTADATDNVGVASVQFYVDGVLTGAQDTVAPYGLTWDTRTVSNGAHTLTAQAYDTSGNAAVSSPVTVNVSNTNIFRNEILATGFNLPTAIKFLPDGRMLVAELTGTIKVLPAPYTSANPTPFLELNLNIAGYAGLQQGIFDFTLDPNFAANHFYYVFYTNDSPNRDRLSRFTANATLDGTVPGSEVILYEDPQTANTEHHGGAVNFGNDGKIYFTTGEHFNGANAQDLTNPRGKIHRINPDGTVPTDNPFYDGAGPNWDSIWAYGLRNPYRAYYDAPTGRLFVGDVGGNDNSTSKEEVNIGVRGANYGWPNVEGTSTNPAYTNPIYAYPHSGRDASITGGFVYHGTQFPSSYQGSYFFADYTQNWIKRLTFDATGNVTGVFNFEPADGSADGPYGDIVYLTEGPEGALYYVDLGYSDVGGTFGVSKIRRIEFLQSDLPPVVVVSATPTPTEGPVPLTVNFSSAGSFDPEGKLLAYSWNFGDGTAISTDANPTHIYTIAGPYQARLTVSDGVNFTISPPLSITAGDRPVISNFLVTVPPNSSNNGLFRAGDVITYSAQATDLEDGTLPPSAYSWTIDFLHEGHVHPGASVTGVTSGSFQIPTSGHDFEGFTRYRITLTVTDSNGLQSSQSTIVFPDKVNLTFDTAPGGLTLYVDGIAHTAPFVYDTLIGFTHTIEARNQTVSASSYTFASWSDSGAQLHTITVPTAAQSYTANYTVVTNPLPSGLAAGWNFNEASGTSATDSSGNGNTATLVNGVARTAGNYSGGLTFDGVNDYLTVPNSPSLDIAGTGLTLTMWINPQALSGGDSVVLGKFWNATMTSPYYQYGLELAGGTVPVFYVGTTGGPLSASMGSALVLNQWSYLAVVFDGSQVKFYLNNVLVTTVPLSATITARSNPFRLGADNNTQQFFKGSLDEVRIYNRALTTQDILTDMTTPL